MRRIYIEDDITLKFQWSLQETGDLKSSMSFMFSRMDGPIDEHMCALFQYTPLAPDGLFASTDFYKKGKKKKRSTGHSWAAHQLPEIVKNIRNNMFCLKKTHDCCDQIYNEIFNWEVCFAKRYVNDSCLVNSVLNLSFLELLDCLKEESRKLIFLLIADFKKEINQSSFDAENIDIG